MNKSRLEILQQSLDQNPGDPFTRYLVALEYVKLNQMSGAFLHFQILVEKNPDYVPTYYQYGTELEKAGRIDDAKRIMRMGIIAAEKAGDAHTKSELQQALDLIEE
jgi:tetratricopeptide (TPR) repeat protein